MIRSIIIIVIQPYKCGTAQLVQDTELLPKTALHFACLQLKGFQIS